MRGKLGAVLRSVRGKLAKFGGKDFDYRRAYSRANLEKDYWSVVGPGSRAEFELLSGIKLKYLIDLGLSPDSRVLDVGCGTGLLAAPLESYLSNSGSYVGLDLAEEAVAFCRSRFRHPNFQFLRNDMTSLPLTDTSFDAIVFYSVFTHTYLNETAALLAEARRLLSADGFVFADVFTSTNVADNKGNRGAVTVNEEQLHRQMQLAGLKAETVMTLDGPDGSRRQFYRLTVG